MSTFTTTYQDASTVDFKKKPPSLADTLMSNLRLAAENKNKSISAEERTGDKSK